MPSHSSDRESQDSGGLPTEETLDTSEPRTRRWATVPNFLSLFRWLGSPFLILLGVLDEPRGFVIAYIVLSLSDWIDGKIAVGWNQRTTLGARLDSWADATLYACLLIGGSFLWVETVAQEWPWIGLAVGSYALASLVGLAKFRRWPSYHTRSAKMAWGFVLLGIACVAWSGPLWPLRLAMVAVTIANSESLWITWHSKRWHNDVIGFWAIPDDEADEA